MLFRVPDYYDDFSCIADRCKDSCCIGWEIDIDEETCSFYKNVPGDFGNRLKNHLYLTPEGENSFRLAAKGRCPFLNECNLCDIYTELGEDALSEVCTEYPRFSVEYGKVLQKCLSLSCEEVARLVFSRSTPVKIIERELAGEDDSDEKYISDEAEAYDENLSDEAEAYDEDPSEEDDAYDEDPSEEDNAYDEDISDEDEKAWFSHMEDLQRRAIDLLSDRSKPVRRRMADYLQLLCPEDEDDRDTGRDTCEENGQTLTSEKSYGDFLARMQVFYEMETLGDEWRRVKAEFRKYYTEENYEAILSEYQSSEAFVESDYEQLMIYFTFRYLMNAVFDYDTASYAKLAVIFTLTIRDMDALRYHLQNKKFNRADRLDVVRIFSKEVEHSQDNIDLVREECLFEDVFTRDALIRQLQSVQSDRNLMMSGKE